MGRRSPSNPRYQKKSGELGKTRRSAASAKPKRGVGENSASASRAKGSKGRKKDRPKLFAPVPTTPEFKRWRKIWMGMLGAAVLLSLIAWWQRDTMPGAIALALAYGCIFGSLYVDFAKMRPLRKKAIAADQAAKPADRAAKTTDRAAKSEGDDEAKKSGKKNTGTK